MTDLHDKEKGKKIDDCVCRCHIEGGFCKLCEMEKCSFWREPPTEEKTMEWETKVWTWITKEMPHKHSDRFIPLFKIIHEVYEKAYQDASKRHRMREGGIRTIALDDVLQMLVKKVNKNPLKMKKDVGLKEAPYYWNGYNDGLKDAVNFVFEMVKNGKGST